MHSAVPLTEQKALQMSLLQKSTRRRGSGVTCADAVVIDFLIKSQLIMASLAHQVTSSRVDQQLQDTGALREPHHKLEH